jgi:hypothetical protein
VLDARYPSTASISRIIENGVTVFTHEVKELLRQREPSLQFRAVRFENEQRVDEVEPSPVYIPSADELKRPR